MAIDSTKIGTVAAQLMEELEEGQTRRGTVRNVMDFGAFVDIGGADGLLHVSEMSWKRGQKSTLFFERR